MISADAVSSAKLMLHICCAPDATVPLPQLIQEGYAVSCCFYEGNIHPETEFQRRRGAVETLCSLFAVPLSVHAYDPFAWFQQTEPYKEQPERGARCAICFTAQLRFAAQRAVLSGCDLLCTTLTISPHKSAEEINAIGEKIASEHALKWVPRIWRKSDGFVRSVRESRRLGLYRQSYCGCIYSLRG